MRLIQAQTMSKAPNTGMATAVDLGDFNNNPYGNIHPRYKQEVGHRLGLVALALTYGSQITYSGPVAQSAKVINTNPVTVEITFDPTSIGKGLQTRSASCVPDLPSCGWLEIMLSDTKWYNATSKIVGNKLQASLMSSNTAKGVRYGMANWPVMTVYNIDGLPAYPFRFYF